MKELKGYIAIDARTKTYLSSSGWGGKYPRIFPTIGYAKQAARCRGFTDDCMKHIRFIVLKPTGEDIGWTGK